MIENVFISPIDNNELDKRIELNFHRLSEGDYYRIGEVFSPASYSWQGDKEGRALLAFVSHYKISGRVIPCMEQMLEKMVVNRNQMDYEKHSFFVNLLD